MKHKSSSIVLLLCTMSLVGCHVACVCSFKKCNKPEDVEVQTRAILETAEIGSAVACAAIIHSQRPCAIVSKGGGVILRLQPINGAIEGASQLRGAISIDKQIQIETTVPLLITYHNDDLLGDEVLMFAGIMSCSNHQPAHAATAFAEMKRLSRGSDGCKGWRFVGAITNDPAFFQAMAAKYGPAHDWPIAP